MTPDVAGILQGLHPFDRSNADDVELEAQAATIIRSWGDKSCRTS